MYESSLSSIHPSINHIVGCQSGDFKRDATNAEIGLGLLNSCTYYLRSLHSSVRRMASSASIRLFGIYPPLAHLFRLEKD